MLKIGFARKYFTLWDVTASTEYGQAVNGNYSYQKTQYTYYRNLSMNEGKALEKAQLAGVKDLTVDSELFGRNGRSFDVCSPVIYEKVAYEDTQFSCGKNRGKYFSECDDINYLQWYFAEFGNLKAAERIVELDDYFVIEDGDLINVDILEDRKKVKLLENVLKTQGFIDIFVDKNVDSYGFINIDGINFNFGKTSENFYRDYAYYLPVSNGKAKRIKNKYVRIFAEFGIVHTEYGDEEVFKVSNFEILK